MVTCFTSDPFYNISTFQIKVSYNVSKLKWIWISFYITVVLPSYSMRCVQKKPSHCSYNKNGSCDISVTWQPGRLDWNAHVWTITRSLYYAMGAVDATEWACALCGRHIQNDWVKNLHKFCVKLEHSNIETTSMTQKATTMGNWWLAASHDNTPSHASCAESCAEFCGETSNHPDNSAPLQPRFGALWLLAFPQTKITSEKEEISDCPWN